MKYYVIAGEASGDLHGSNLIKGIKKSDATAEFRMWGGDLMQAQGGNLVKHYRDLAFMGLVEVLKHLNTISANLKFCKSDIIAYKPDVLILIDYPGFNLRIAEFAKKNGIKVFYYISPKVWAWKESRVKALKKYVDKLFVIFPFEIEYFKKFGIEVEYFGNPLADPIYEFRQRQMDFETFTTAYNLSKKPIIAILAGSRKQEIKQCLPEMMEAIKTIKGYQFVIAGAPSLTPELYAEVIGDADIKVVYNETYNIVANATAAIVTSGTATLETALLKTPQVVVYKTSPITYRIGRYLVKLKYFSLVNLIEYRQVVKELLQFNLVEDIRNEMDLLLNDKEYRARMKAEYDHIENLLGTYGVSDRVGAKMVSLIK